MLLSADVHVDLLNIESQETPVMNAMHAATLPVATLLLKHAADGSTVTVMVKLKLVLPNSSHMNTST